VNPLRILVTGSRNLRDHDLVRGALLDALATYSTIGRPVLVHGGQVSTDPATGERYGADWIAEYEWRALSEAFAVGDFALELAVEAHPADWSRHGRAAGPIRNREMVAAGATCCVAFPLGRSPGTRGCMRLAEAAGIPVLNYGDKEPM
jgi:hypothetical protein